MVQAGHLSGRIPFFPAPCHNFWGESNSPGGLVRESEDKPALEDPLSQGTQPKYIFSADETSLRSKKKRKDIEGIEDEEDEDDTTSERKKNPGRRKIDIEYIQDKSKRHITFSKRKAGIMKKAYELATLTGTQLLLLVVSETGIVYTFTTPNLQPIVSDDPGKSLISSCLNDGEAEIRIEQEDPEDELPANPAAAAEEQDLMVMPSNHPVTSSTSGHLQQPMSESYHPNNQSNTCPAPWLTVIPSHISINPPSIYPSRQQIGSSASDSLSTIPNLQICSSRADLYEFTRKPTNVFHGRLHAIGGSKRKPQNQETQDGNGPSQSTATPPLPSQFPFEVQNNWLETPDQMKLGPISANQGTVFDSPAFNTVVSSFLLRECNNFYSPIELETTNRNLQSQVEHNVVLFLDACDHYPLGDSTLGPRKWRQELFPRKELLAECLKFFFEEYLPLMKHLPLESLTSCCEDLQKLVQFASIFYGAPEQDAAELCEVIKHSSSSYMHNIHRGPHGSTSAQGGPITSPIPNTYNTRLKCAPKLKPRKGVNITLRGGRLQTVLEEYTDWCRRNKSSWSGNKPNSHVKGWFKMSEFGARSAILRGNHGSVQDTLPGFSDQVNSERNKLELEVQNSDDGSEWNIFNHFNYELSPGDEQEEEESNVLPSEGTVDSALLQRICEEKKLHLSEAQRWIENQRLMKLYIEAGDFDDDGFESKVPPKGGKQAFRVKKPSIADQRPAIPLSLSWKT
ncbi:hypothetical protein PSTT_16118, partial [Puccinia striiformis]